MKVNVHQTRPILGLDVGKSSHWACLLEGDTVTINRPVANREAALDELFAKAVGALVVVDQFRNIGALAVSRARLAGLDVAYLPGIVASQAAKLFPGEAKTDERDAHVIARTAIGIPDALRSIPYPAPEIRAARIMAAQRDHLVCARTADKNRLRAILFESCPAFETYVDLKNRHWVHLLACLGDPWSILDARKASVGALTRGADRDAVDAACKAIAASERPDDLCIQAEKRLVLVLAQRIEEATAEIERLEKSIDEILACDITYRCLLTIPGIGHRCAAELVLSITIDAFADHDHLASYCGLAPCDRKSGTSIAQTRSSRANNKKLKGLLMFSCNSLVKSKDRFGCYYRACRERGMHHNQAIKATARKRMKVIYAIMRDKVPYTA